MFTSVLPFRLVLLLASLSTFDGQQQPTPPRFTGKSIPDPPRQKEPWTAPATKLPKSLLVATEALFEQGLADPRGCEYREVEVVEGLTVKTHGFVLPPREGESGRFVVGWDAVVRPAVSVGAPADLDRDIQVLADRIRLAHQAAAAEAKTNRLDRPVPYWWSGPDDRGGPAVESGSALKVCVLLRLGRADLAETLFAAATPWTPEARDVGKTDYQVNYLSLAQEWGSTLYGRLISAHMLGDDVIALDAARRLSAFEKAVDVRASEMGFERNTNYQDQPPSYFPWHRQLPELLADHERRAREPARGPIPRRGTDPAARVAALIRDLDQIDERQISSPGAASPGNSPLVKALIAEGGPAVEPLLTAYETDTRLTRSVTSSHGTIFVHPVADAELAALAGILQGADFQAFGSNPYHADLAKRKELTQSLRDFWAKNRGISPMERWYRLLSDDEAGRDRWLEAAAHIVQPRDETGPAFNGRTELRVRVTHKRPPMKGEELRARRDPSVSTLMVRRIVAIAESGNPLQHPNIELYRACEMGMDLLVWDEKAALPILRALMTGCGEDMEITRNQGGQLDQSMSRFVVQFTLIRAKAGDREAVGEYAAWIRKCRPKELEYHGFECFEPLWTYPDDPAIRDAAKWLFTDPESPWLGLFRNPGSYKALTFNARGLMTSPLLRVEAFRAAVITALRDRSRNGMIRRSDRRVVQYTLDDGGNESYSSDRPDLDEVEQGVDRPFRVCDHIAWLISGIEGSPRCELYWPEDRRDRAVAACAEFLRKYGERFTAVPPSGDRDFPTERAHLAFPRLDRPATPEDVRAGRAIFSLEGEGKAERRPFQVPERPFLARWVTLKEFPVERMRGDRTTFREFDQLGWIWQAEEVRRGDRWERYLGFVGRNIIARVPAAEIEFTPNRYRNDWSQLPGGLDARIEAEDRHPAAYEPGQPVRMIVRLRNRRGVENTAPTEFLRPGADGRPALRRGVTLAVSFTPPRGAPLLGQESGRTEELKPRRTDRFDADAATRPMAPFETLDAMRLEVGDWFDVSRTGYYRVRLVFAADSGVGAGTTNDAYFQVGQPEEQVP